MVYREIIAICSQIHKKQMNTLSAENVNYIKSQTVPVSNQYRTQLNKRDNKCLIGKLSPFELRSTQTDKHTVWEERRIIYEFTIRTVH
jgi:hypothetical protein